MAAEVRKVVGKVGGRGIEGGAIGGWPLGTRHSVEGGAIGGWRVEIGGTRAVWQMGEELWDGSSREVLAGNKRHFSGLIGRAANDAHSSMRIAACAAFFLPSRRFRVFMPSWRETPRLKRARMATWRQWATET